MLIEALLAYKHKKIVYSVGMRTLQESNSLADLHSSLYQGFIPKWILLDEVLNKVNLG